MAVLITWRSFTKCSGPPTSIAVSDPHPQRMRSNRCILSESEPIAPFY